MKIINSTPIFNLINNGFAYLCQIDDGTYWIRSTMGKWTQIKISTPMDTDTVEKDFDAFLKAGVTYTENDIKVDNSSQTIVDPIKGATLITKP